MKRILQIVTGLGTGDGKAEVVCRLSRELARRGWAVTIATVDEGARDVPGVRIARFRPGWPRIVYFSGGMARGLRALVREADVVQVHGSWTFPVWWGCRCAAAEKKRLVVTPHGSFDPVRLAYSGWKKRIVGWLDRRSLRLADVVQATSEQERGWIEAFCSGLNVAVVPNGVDLPPEASRPAGKRLHTLLYIGRNHPLKGIDLLRAAWKRVARPDWELKLVGPGLPGGIVEGPARDRLLAEADCVVLPTRSENFGLVVAEALAAGTPAVCTRAAPWECLRSEACGWWCETSAEGLAAALEQMMQLTDDERGRMGANGRALIGRRFTWDRIAQEVESLYGRLD